MQKKTSSLNYFIIAITYWAYSKLTIKLNEKTKTIKQSFYLRQINNSSNSCCFIVMLYSVLDSNNHRLTLKPIWKQIFNPENVRIIELCSHYYKQLKIIRKFNQVYKHNRNLLSVIRELKKVNQHQRTTLNDIRAEKIFGVARKTMICICLFF
jgi:hypothetical protein